MAALAAMTHDFADRARDATGRLFVTPRSREAAVLAGLVSRDCIASSTSAPA